MEAAAFAARAFGLDSVPLDEERFDPAVRREDLHLSAVRALSGVLTTAVFRQRLEAAAGYDGPVTGKTQIP
jgi:molybdate-binding protein